MNDTDATQVAQIKRLLESAETAHRLATKMLETGTEIDGGMEAVARGVKDLAKASTLGATLAEQRRGKAMVDKVMALDSADDYWEDPERGGSLFSADAKAGLVQAVKTRTAYRTEVDRKALVGPLLPAAGSGVATGLQPNAVTSIADLFPNQPAEGPVQRYYRITAGTAGVVAEGQEKPESGTAVTAHDIALLKIAARTRVSDEMSEDAAYLLDAFAADLQAAVVARENTEIVSAFAAASGILTSTGPAGDVVDLVGSAVAGQESISGITPAAVIAHPTQVAGIRALKASTSGVYVADPWTAGPPTLHGLRLVSTTAVAAGTVWVVSGQAAVIYRRGPVTVEIGHDGTDFSTNMRTVIAEERMAPAVVRPQGLTRITLT